MMGIGIEGEGGEEDASRGKVRVVPREEDLPTKEVRPWTPRVDRKGV